MQRLFEGGAYSSNYCNWQLKSLLHLGQIVITFRTLLHLGQNVIIFKTLLHLGPFISFRPSTVLSSLSLSLSIHTHVLIPLIQSSIDSMALDSFTSLLGLNDT